MTYVDLFLENVKKKVINLSHEHISLFIMLTLEKMSPAYKIFYEKENWGNLQLLNDIVHVFKNEALNETLSKKDLRKIIKQVGDICPDLDEFETIIASFARDSCLAYYSAVLFLMSNKIEDLVDVIVISIDTIDMYVNVTEDPDFTKNLTEEEIEKNEFMQRELKRQLIFLDKLEITKKISAEIIDEMRELNDSYGEMINLKLITER